MGSKFDDEEDDEAAIFGGLSCDSARAVQILNYLRSPKALLHKYTSMYRGAELDLDVREVPRKKQGKSFTRKTWAM